MGFRLLVFDWDGTLMDSEAHIVACMQQAARDFGLGPISREAGRDVIGLGLYQAASVLLPHASDESRLQFTERYRQHFLATASCDGIPASRFFPGARGTLDELRARGYLLAVATGKGRRGLDSAMEATGTVDTFHATRCADETASKPDPRMLVELTEELGVEPALTVMVGDTEYDMHMARNAGAASVAVSYGVHDRDRLMACGPLTCLERIGDLLTWLEGAHGLPEAAV
jgi:phosphoglycolate phosphatase